MSQTRAWAVIYITALMFAIGSPVCLPSQAAAPTTPSLQEAKAPQAGTAATPEASARPFRPLDQVASLNEPKPAPANAARPKAPTRLMSQGKQVAQDALRYRGVPYRWGGFTSRGLDCSGLVARVLMQNGIHAPHNSASLYKLGQKVTYSQLKAGDLLFFNTRGRGISHVGIYLGDNKFVHASSGSREVTVSSLSDKYYQRRLVGARRLTKAGGDL